MNLALQHLLRLEGHVDIGPAASNRLGGVLPYGVIILGVLAEYLPIEVPGALAGRCVSVR
jgi:hypothetical protein